jgi:sugar phosphate isomerase/epimerase
VHGPQDFGLLLDIFHMHNEEWDLLRVIRDHESITMHVHIADHIHSLDFTRVDSTFVRSAISALRDASYVGYTSFGSFHPSVSFGVFAAALQVIKKYSGNSPAEVNER